MELARSSANRSKMELSSFQRTLHKVQRSRRTWLLIGTLSALQILQLRGSISLIEFRLLRCLTQLEELSKILCKTHGLSRRLMQRVPNLVKFTLRMRFLSNRSRWTKTLISTTSKVISYSPSTILTTSQLLPTVVPTSEELWPTSVAHHHSLVSYQKELSSMMKFAKVTSKRSRLVL
jgi:hypothetical protein